MRKLPRSTSSEGPPPESPSSLNCCTCASASCSATLFITVVATACSTALLVAAVITDHWEHVAWDWDRERVARVEHAMQRSATANATHHWRLDWFIDGQVRSDDDGCQYSKCE